MIHPYDRSDRLPYMDMTLKMCTLYKGRPYGPAYIKFVHHRKRYLSFDGLGIFTNGKLDKGPFFFIDGDGCASSYSLMHEGRPADEHYATYFMGNKAFIEVNSRRNETDVSFC